MKVRELLESKGKEIVSIDSTFSVEDAIRIMNKRKISAVLVMGDMKTAGIFTERDVVRCYATADGKDFKDIPIAEAMIKDLVVAEMEDDLHNIMAVMVDKNIRHLPVVEKGTVIGMLSVRDIIQTLVGKLNSEIHHLKDYITNI